MANLNVGIRDRGCENDRVAAVHRDRIWHRVRILLLATSATSATDGTSATSAASAATAAIGNLVLSVLAPVFANGEKVRSGHSLRERVRNFANTQGGIANSDCEKSQKGVTHKGYEKQSM